MKENGADFTYHSLTITVKSSRKPEKSPLTRPNFQPIPFNSSGITPMVGTHSVQGSVKLWRALHGQRKKERQMGWPQT